MIENRFIRSLEICWDRIPADSYLRSIPAIASLRRMDFEKNITFFVGENTTGKSSLLEAIAAAYGFNPEGGTMNYRFSTYDDLSELHNAVRLVKGYNRALTGYFFRAESFFNLATKADEYDRLNPRGPSSLTVRAFSASFRPLRAWGSISWMSRRPPSRPSGS